VRITAVRLQPYALPLKAAWQSAAGTLSVRHGWLIQLETDSGLTGYGECAPLPSHGSEDPADAERALNRWAATLPGQWVETVLAELAAPATCATPAARAAVEAALLDLLSQQAGSPLANYLCQQECSRNVAVNTMLGTTVGFTEAQLDEALTANYSVIKLKVGIAAPEDEIAALRHLAQRLPANTRLRLDANRAWTMDSARHYCDALSGLPIESIEEPLAKPVTKDLRALQQQLSFPLALDESLHGQAAEFLCGEAPVRRLVLKLAPLGGLLPALVLAQRASAAGLECVVTTGIDSACGTLAATHLAAALGNSLAHGLATSSWLAHDTGAVPAIGNGRLYLPENCGLGFRPSSASRV
jgi:o-succinylbenzoate synthase